MPHLDERDDSLCFKIVFYGPGHSGKSTALRHVHSVLPGEHKGKLVCLATETDRTLFFDFCPIQFGEVDGLGRPVRFHLYTAPGQVFYDEARRLILKDVDGVVFVVDSRAARETANAESLQSLRENVRTWGIEVADLPLVFLYNKRDVPDRVPVAKLRARLNPEGRPDFEAVASSGQGVLEMLGALCDLVVERAPSRTAGRATPGGRRKP